jgi:hypothetical protein
MQTRIKIRGKQLFPLQCADISMGGMRIKIKPDLHPFVESAKGKLWLAQQYSGETIKFEAQFKVSWVRSMPRESNMIYIGIEFIKMKRKHQESLLKLLQVQGSIEG